MDTHNLENNTSRTIRDRAGQIDTSFQHQRKKRLEDSDYVISYSELKKFEEEGTVKNTEKMHAVVEKHLRKLCKNNLLDFDRISRTDTKSIRHLGKLFLCFLSKKYTNQNTLRMYKSWGRLYFRETWGFDLCESASLKKINKAFTKHFREQSGGETQAIPIFESELLDALNRYYNSNNEKSGRILYSEMVVCMLSVGFLMAARPAELARLKVDHIRFKKQNQFQVFQISLPASKTLARVRTFKIDSPFAKFIQPWANRMKGTENFLFSKYPICKKKWDRNTSFSRFLGEEIRAVIQKPKSQISSYSLRVGRALDLLIYKKKSHEYVRLLGGWKSEAAFGRYVNLKSQYEIQE